jgi:TPR repeat protein
MKRLSLSSIPLLFTGMILCVIVACGSHRTGTENGLRDKAEDMDTLAENAESGTAEGKYQLGMRYEKGGAVPQNYPEAVRWYRLSAMQGYPGGQYKLCEMSERGQGLPQDYQEALRWCGLAADQGHGPAMFMLGRLYHTGHGVPRDLVRAHMWYNLATANGYDEGKKWRDRLADDMNQGQIAEAQKLAREWSVRMNRRS